MQSLGLELPTGFLIVLTAAVERTPYLKKGGLYMPLHEELPIMVATRGS